MTIFDVKKSLVDEKVSGLFDNSAKPLGKPTAAQEDSPKKRPASEVEEASKEPEQESEQTQKKKPRKVTKKKETTDENTSNSENESESESENVNDNEEKEQERKQEQETTTDQTKPAKKESKENEEEKAQRTVFVGNVPKEVVSENTKYTEFKNLFATMSNGKVESIRFRSIAFSEILPRKMAFKAHKLHESRNSLNAYVVLDSPKSARRAQEMNGTVFSGNHLRVDSVAHPAQHDSKRCIFVGNLDFELDEEPLWRHFSNCGKIEYVRIIRDSKTNMGKGFAYVQFEDSVSIEKALLLHDKPLTGVTKASQARKLRISRAKNLNKPSRNEPLTAKKWREQKAKEHGKNKHISGKQATELGRAKNLLGKSARAKLVEGMRATPKDAAVLKTRKKHRK